MIALLDMTEEVLEQAKYGELIVAAPAEKVVA